MAKCQACKRNSQPQRDPKYDADIPGFCFHSVWLVSKYNTPCSVNQARIFIRVNLINYMYFRLVMRYNFYVTVGQPAAALESYEEHLLSVIIFYSS